MTAWPTHTQVGSALSGGRVVPGLRVGLLPSQQRAIHNNEILGRAANGAYRAGTLSGLDHATVQGKLIALDRLIQRPPRNRAGQNCWTLSAAHAGVVSRWIYGGGNIGDIAEGIFGISRGGPGRGWNLNWSLSDILTGMGLPVLDCEGYFTKIRMEYDALNGIMASAGQAAEAELAQAAAQEIASRHFHARDPLTAPPENKPWLILALTAAAIGGGLYGLKKMRII